MEVRLASIVACHADGSLVWLTVWVLSLSLVFIACIELWSYDRSLQVLVAYGSILQKGLACIVTRIFCTAQGSKVTMFDMSLPSRAGSLFLLYFFSRLHRLAFIAVVNDPA